MYLVEKYTGLLRSYPIFTRSWTSFVLSFSADITSQYIESSYDKLSFLSNLNFKRSFNLALYTSSFTTPMIYLWFQFLAKKFPGTGFRPIAIKFALDRVLMPAPFLLLLFTSQTYMNGGNYTDLKNRLEKNYVDALKLNFLVWPVASLVNFRFIPLHYQVLYMNVLGPQ